MRWSGVEANEHRPGFSARTIALVVVLLLVANAALGFLVTRQAEDALMDQVKSRMMDVACSAADLLNGDELAVITERDIYLPKYRRALKTLRSFQENTDLAFVYCVRETADGNFEFTIDPSEDPAEFGEHAVLTDALVAAGKGTAGVDLVAYTDRWGSFYSAYCPVFDKKGAVASVVGVDFDAAWYEEHSMLINRLAIVNALASLVMALLAVLVVARHSRAETKHMESLLRASQHDALTGLPNMGYFIELGRDVYDEMVERDEEPVVLYMDLIDMRYYNQKHGFAGGDELLKAFAAFIEARFGEGRCARFGQDHFAALTNADNLEERLDSFLSDCAFINGGNSLPVCVGVCRDVEGRASIGTACDRAKMASKEGRAGHRSSYLYFTKDMTARADRRQYILDNFERALAEGWIEVRYQAIVRSSTGKVCDEEALARWNDPDLGMLSPAEFVPVLEDAKLIYKLDLNVLEQVLAKMKRVEGAGLYIVPASINLSRIDFELCDMVEEVRKRVDASGMERDKISVEITETAMGRGFEFMQNQVERFHELGFNVWMDDFGSEYSSLDYLQNLHFDLLKLDMSFMRRFGEGEKSKFILTEVVKMALALGMETVCEGVETQEQVEFLREVGCSKMQGFYFTKPLSLEELLKRYEGKMAIGFENPLESAYYSAIGRVNLYDLSSISRGDDEGLRHYFDTFPMAIIEVTDEQFTVVRCNKSYRTFMERSIGRMHLGVTIAFDEARRLGGAELLGHELLAALRRCRTESDWVGVDDITPTGAEVHAIMRRIADNPVTGKTALAVAIVSVSDD